MYCPQASPGKSLRGCSIFPLFVSDPRNPCESPGFSITGQQGGDVVSQSYNAETSLPGRLDSARNMRLLGFVKGKLGAGASAWIGLNKFIMRQIKGTFTKNQQNEPCPFVWFPALFVFVVPASTSCPPRPERDRRCEFDTIARRCFPLSFCTRWFRFSLWCLPKPIATITMARRTLRPIRRINHGTSTRNTDVVCSRTRVGFFFPPPRARCNPNGTECNPNETENHPSAGIILENQDHHLLVFDGGIAKFRYQYQGRSVEVLDLSLWSRLLLKRFFQVNISERFLHGRGGPLKEVQHEQF